MTPKCNTTLIHQWNNVTTETNKLTIQHCEECSSYKWKINTLWNIYEKLSKVSQQSFFKGRWFSYKVLWEFITFTGGVLKPDKLT